MCGVTSASKFSKVVTSIRNIDRNSSVSSVISSLTKLADIPSISRRPIQSRTQQDRVTRWRRRRIAAISVITDRSLRYFRILRLFCFCNAMMLAYNTILQKNRLEKRGNILKIVEKAGLHGYGCRARSVQHGRVIRSIFWPPYTYRVTRPGNTAVLHGFLNLALRVGLHIAAERSLATGTQRLHSARV